MILKMDDIIKLTIQLENSDGVTTVGILRHGPFTEDDMLICFLRAAASFGMDEKAMDDAIVDQAAMLKVEYGDLVEENPLISKIEDLLSGLRKDFTHYCSFLTLERSTPATSAIKKIDDFLSEIREQYG